MSVNIKVPNKILGIRIKYYIKKRHGQIWFIIGHKGRPWLGNLLMQFTKLIATRRKNHLLPSTEAEKTWQNSMFISDKNIE